MTSAPPKRKHEDENSPSKALNMPGDICKHCNKRCTSKGKSSEAIQCDICFVWVHAACEGFTKEQFKTFSDLSKSFPNIAYCCKLNGCLTRLNQLVASKDTSELVSPVEIGETLTDLEKKYSLLNETITKTFANVDTLSSNNTELQNKISNLAKPVDSKSGIQANTVSVTKIVDEYRDIERRKWNVIVFDVPEPKSADTSQRKTEDREFFNSLVENIGIAPVDIANVTRLGAKVANKSHPLRVQLNNLSQRRSVLSNAKKLCNSSSRAFKEIFINPDLSPKERQAQKELRSELARRKEAGESGIFIRRGRIVKQNKTINQAVSNPQEVPSEDMDDQSG